MLAGGGVCRIRDSGVRVLRVVAVVILVRELEPGLDVFVAGVVERSEDLDVGLLAVALVGEEASRDSAGCEAIINREADTAQGHVDESKTRNRHVLPMNDTWNRRGYGSSLERSMEDVLIGGPDARARDVAAGWCAARDREYEIAVLDVDVIRGELSSVWISRLVNEVGGDADVVLGEELGDSEIRGGVSREVHGERLSHHAREKQTDSGNNEFQDHSAMCWKYQVSGRNSRVQ